MSVVTVVMLGFALSAMARASPPEGRIAVQVDRKHTIQQHAQAELGGSTQTQERKIPAHIKVKVVKCENLPDLDWWPRVTDAFVEVTVTSKMKPKGGVMKKTKTVSHSVSPQFNQELTYTNIKDPKNAKVTVRVFDSDGMFGQEDIGDAHTKVGDMGKHRLVLTGDKAKRTSICEIHVTAYGFEAEKKEEEKKEEEKKEEEKKEEEKEPVTSSSSSSSSSSDEEAPPNYVLSINFDKKEYKGRPHFPVSIGVSVSGGNAGSDLTYKWTFGKGDKLNPKFHHPVDGPSVTHTFPDEADDYKAQVTVTDEKGATATETVNIKVASPSLNADDIEIFHTGPCEPDWPCYFSASYVGSETDTKAFEYTWDFQGVNAGGKSSTTCLSYGHTHGVGACKGNVVAHTWMDSDWWGKKAETRVVTLTVRTGGKSRIVKNFGVIVKRYTEANAGEKIVRKEIRHDGGSMWKERVVPAIHALKRNGMYDFFMLNHLKAAGLMQELDSKRSAAHAGPNFLPWHRVLVRVYERAIQAMDLALQAKNINWKTGSFKKTPDWSEDPKTKKWHGHHKKKPVHLPFWHYPHELTKGSIFTKDYIGGLKGIVQDGPFGKSAKYPDGSLKFPVHEMGVNSPHLTRGSRGRGPFSIQGRSQTEIDNIVTITDYDRPPYSGRLQQLDEHNKASGITFKNALEGFTSSYNPHNNCRKHGARCDQRKYGNIHNAIHGAIGGDMGRLSSPNDPVFYLHHMNVDRIYDKWQRGAGKWQYSPMDCKKSSHSTDKYCKYLKKEQYEEDSKHSSTFQKWLKSEAGVWDNHNRVPGASTVDGENHYEIQYQHWSHESWPWHVKISEAACGGDKAPYHCKGKNTESSLRMITFDHSVDDK
jgi:tyrosinase